MRWLLLVLALLSFNVVGDEFICLAKNIYFEARGESVAGKVAVGLVTLNRVQSSQWPNTICEVVYQPSQFSWTNDGKSDQPNNQAAWKDAQAMALISLELFVVKDAHWFHTNQVVPYWTMYHKHVVTIGNHKFYE